MPTVLPNTQVFTLKLSKRLKQIEQLVTSEYKHIWDCCCDHGFLGAALLNRQAADHIHFVDIVPELMSALENKLVRYFPDSKAWHTHCMNVAELPLSQFSKDDKHLIIIAGVGGDLMIEFIDAIEQANPDLDIDFLLCPVHHQYVLRQKLIELNYRLKQEVLVEDNQRFYEIILVSSHSRLSQEDTPVSPVGDMIWQATTENQKQVAQQYLTKTLSHYQRIQQGNATDVSHIINAYRTVSF
ncbi:SAM-dependent methyltransferase [Photobacterium jeanii]|nr:SAM-dependent methyltransferase [Photobacterium jeanii]